MTQTFAILNFGHCDLLVFCDLEFKILVLENWDFIFFILFFRSLEARALPDYILVVFKKATSILLKITLQQAAGNLPRKEF
jgi:hypothetical protein